MNDNLSEFHELVNNQLQLKSNAKTYKDTIVYNPRDTMASIAGDSA